MGMLTNTSILGGVNSGGAGADISSAPSYQSMPPISGGTGGPGFSGAVSGGAAAIGAGIGALLAIPTGGLSVPIGAAIGSAIGAGTGALGGGLLDWIMAEDAADKQQQETDRINREMMRQRNEEIARDERWATKKFKFAERQQRETEMMNAWKMRNEDSDRRLQRGFLFANTLTNMMNSNQDYRTHLLNVRRGAV